MAVEFAKSEILHDNVAKYLTSSDVEAKLEEIANDILTTMPKRHYHYRIITWAKYSRVRRKVLQMYVLGATEKNLAYKQKRLLKGVLAYKK